MVIGHWPFRDLHTITTCNEKFLFHMPSYVLKFRGSVSLRKEAPMKSIVYFVNKLISNTPCLSFLQSRVPSLFIRGRHC